MRLIRHGALSTALLACNPDSGATTSGDSTGASESTGAASTANPSTTGEPTTTGVTTGEPATTGAPGSSTGLSTGDDPGDDTDAPSDCCCWGLHVNAPEPYLDFYDYQGVALADGVTLPLECGGQGLWMFGLYPKFGGWDPMDTSVTFAVTVDVEGFNLGPSGHFYRGDVGYYVGCEDVDGGVPGVVPILPPDELADLSQLDGLTAQVHVEIAADGEAVTFDAAMPLSAPKELVDEGCIFNP